MSRLILSVVLCCVACASERTQPPGDATSDLRSADVAVGDDVSDDSSLGDIVPAGDGTGAVADTGRRSQTDVALDTSPDSASGNGCDDGDPCTENYRGSSGCVFPPAACTDGDPCTIDGCTPGEGCLFKPADCDDGKFCTLETCKAGSGCQFRPNPCLDGDLCTLDACKKGKCVHTPAFEGRLCGTDARCKAGVCTPVACKTKEPASILLPTTALWTAHYAVETASHLLVVGLLNAPGKGAKTLSGMLAFKPGGAFGKPVALGAMWTRRLLPTKAGAVLGGTLMQASGLRHPVVRAFTAVGAPMWTWTGDDYDEVSDLAVDGDKPIAAMRTAANRVNVVALTAGGKVDWTWKGPADGSFKGWPRIAVTAAGVVLKAYDGKTQLQSFAWVTSQGLVTGPTALPGFKSSLLVGVSGAEVWLAKVESGGCVLKRISPQGKTTVGATLKPCWYPHGLIDASGGIRIAATVGNSWQTKNQAWLWRASTHHTVASGATIEVAGTMVPASMTRRPDGGALVLAPLNTEATDVAEALAAETKSSAPHPSLLLRLSPNGELDCTTGGACLTGPVCDDAKPCTADACAPQSGCTHLPVAATACFAP